MRNFIQFDGFWSSFWHFFVDVALWEWEGLDDAWGIPFVSNGFCCWPIFYLWCFRSWFMTKQLKLAWALQTSFPPFASRCRFRGKLTLIYIYFVVLYFFRFGVVKTQFILIAQLYFLCLARSVILCGRLSVLITWNSNFSSFFFQNIFFFVGKFHCWWPQISFLQSSFFLQIKQTIFFYWKLFSHFPNKFWEYFTIFHEFFETFSCGTGKDEIFHRLFRFLSADAELDLTFVDLISLLKAAFHLLCKRR